MKHPKSWKKVDPCPGLGVPRADIYRPLWGSEHRLHTRRSRRASHAGTSKYQKWIAMRRIKGRSGAVLAAAAASTRRSRFAPYCTLIKRLNQASHAEAHTMQRAGTDGPPAPTYMPLHPLCAAHLRRGLQQRGSRTPTPVRELPHRLAPIRAPLPDNIVRFQIQVVLRTEAFWAQRTLLLGLRDRAWFGGDADRQQVYRALGAGQHGQGPAWDALRDHVAQMTPGPLPKPAYRPLVRYYDVHAYESQWDTLQTYQRRHHHQRLYEAILRMSVVRDLVGKIRDYYLERK